MSANLIVKLFDIRLIYTQILVCLSNTLKKIAIWIESTWRVVYLKSPALLIAKVISGVFFPNI